MDQPDPTNDDFYGPQLPPLTDEEPFWAHLPRAEVLFDATAEPPLFLRRVAGIISDDVLREAAVHDTLNVSDIGKIVGVSHQPLTGYYELTRPGDPPIYDVRHRAPYPLGDELRTGLQQVESLTELADVMRRNTAHVAARLQQMHAAGWQLTLLEGDDLTVTVTKDEDTTSGT